MDLHGFIHKSRHGEWVAEIPSLHIKTYGHSRSEALFLAQDALEELANFSYLEVDFVLNKDNSFDIVCSNDLLLQNVFEDIYYGTG